MHRCSKHKTVVACLLIIKRLHVAHHNPGKTTLGVLLLKFTEYLLPVSALMAAIGKFVGNRAFSLFAADRKAFEQNAVLLQVFRHCQAWRTLRISLTKQNDAQILSLHANLPLGRILLLLVHFHHNLGGRRLCLGKAIVRGNHRELEALSIGGHFPCQSNLAKSRVGDVKEAMVFAVLCRCRLIRSKCVSDSGIPWPARNKRILLQNGSKPLTRHDLRPAR